jgi:beta-galactosidase
MPISRRDFLESGALTAAGVVFGNLMTPANAFGSQATPAVSERSYRWPRKPESRIVLSFDEGWRFLGPESPSSSSSDALSAARDSADIAVLKDSDWEVVNLPHTVRLEPLNASGGRNYQGLCWYQKHFAGDPTWRGRTVYVVFQGAMQVADVWLNGKHLTTHYGGYLPFTLDISE